MANGDAAAAAGLATFAQTQDHSLGYDNDNIRGDELANHMVNGTHPWSKITGTSSAIQTANLANSAVTTAKIADGAVTEPKIAAGAVTNAKIGTDAVTQSKIADAAVGTAQLQTNAVTNVEIAPGAVRNSSIDSNAVTASKIAPGSIETAALQSECVTPAKLGTDAVTRAKIANEAVGWAELDDDVVNEITGGGGITSSLRYKHDVTSHTSDVAALLDLEPVTYLRIANPDAGREFGLIAEQVDELGLEHLLVRDAQGRPDGIRYAVLAVALLDVVKDQHARLTALEQTLATLTTDQEA